MKDIQGNRTLISMTKINIYVVRLFIFMCSIISVAVMAALPANVDGEKLPSLAPMLEGVTPAVVNIATEGRVLLRQNPLFSDPFFRRFFNVPDQPIERKTQSLGSGVIVDAKRGLVLTNNHVIANAIQITVGLNDGRTLEAELVGTDPETDVAVIKIPADNLTAIKISDSDKLRVGDYVVAIGNPFGLGQTVTSGIVSALARSGLGILDYENYIQTDASINPGNSGGALVNLRGELVAINDAIFSQSGGSIGIGFAIPINLALHVMEQLVETGYVQRGVLGVQTQDLNPLLAEAFGLKQKKGAVVTRVMDNSPAEKAGLQAGDIIIKINGRDVKNSSDVRNRVGLIPVGENVTFEILRGGERKKISTTVVAGETTAGSPDAVNKKLEGMSVGDIAQGHPLFGKVNGVLVADVQRGSPVWRSGLRQGDIITSVNHEPVENLKEFLAAVDQKKGSLLLRIIRGDAAAFIVVK